MSYQFDGVDDQVQWSVGSCNLTGAYTMVMVAKQDTGVTWQSYLGNEHATNGSEHAFARNNSNQLWQVLGGGAGGAPNVTTTFLPADGWSMCCVGRNAGAGQTFRITKYPIGGSPTHANTAGTSGDAATQAGGKIVFGQIDGSDFFKGWLAVCAEFATNLSDADRQSLVTTFTRANWLSLGAVGLWDATDQFAADQTGNGATRSSLTGTTSSVDDPTGWASWAGAAATELPILVMAPPIPA